MEEKDLLKAHVLDDLKLTYGDLYCIYISNDDIHNYFTTIEVMHIDEHHIYGKDLKADTINRLLEDSNHEPAHKTITMSFEEFCSFNPRKVDIAKEGKGWKKFDKPIDVDTIYPDGEIEIPEAYKPITVDKFNTTPRADCPSYGEPIDMDRNKDWLTVAQFNGRGLGYKEGDFEIDDAVKTEFDEYQEFFDSLPAWKKEWFMENIQKTQMLYDKKNSFDYLFASLDNLHEITEDREQRRREDMEIKIFRQQQLLNKFETETNESIDSFYKPYTLTYLKKCMKYKIGRKKFDNN